MSKQRRLGFGLGLVSAWCAWAIGMVPTAQALDLDWSGQFRAEAHYIFNYTMDTANLTLDTTRRNAEGYYIPSGGERDAAFQSLFMRLRPSLIVNDNISVKSEWWVGDPIYGFFGGSAPYGVDQRQYYSNQVRSSIIAAQRFWAEIVSNYGTLIVGRAPLQWGLGVVWNNGNQMWDRYLSTGDALRVVSKFGAFTLMPSVVKYSQGNSIGGGCNDPTGTTPCSSVGANAAVADYSFAMLYSNTDEEMVLGVNFIRRLINFGQVGNSAYYGLDGNSIPESSNFNVWDIYAEKKFGDLKLAFEVPIASGTVGNVSYNALAAAMETSYEVSKTLWTGLRAGYAPGSANIANSTTPSRFSSFYFHPGYKVGMIMFNYQLANFSGPSTLNDPGTPENNLRSPFDNPITDAVYFDLGAKLKSGKWDFRGNFIYALAPNTAVAGQRFYNNRLHKFVDNNSGVSQGNALGFEVDLGAGIQWDDAFRLDLDTGVFLPGSFWAFSNTAGGNPTQPVWAITVKGGVEF